MVSNLSKCLLNILIHMILIQNLCHFSHSGKLPRPKSGKSKPDNSGYGEKGIDMIIAKEDPPKKSLLANGLWPNGIVYYFIERNFSLKYVNAITWAMSRIEEHTCVRFYRQLMPDAKTLYIQNRASVCQATVGTFGDPTLDYRRHVDVSEIGTSGGKGCDKGTVLHELSHVLGVVHEHQRNDRDEYVNILWQNIEPKKEIRNNFDPISTALITPYDYGSIMHYGNTAFAVPQDKTTIKAKKDLHGKKMGQRDGLSPYDIVRINRMYHCYEENCKDRDKNCDAMSMLQRFCEIQDLATIKKRCQKTCGMCSPPKKTRKNLGRKKTTRPRRRRR